MNWSVNLAGLGLGGPHDGYLEHGVYGANYKENSPEELDFYKSKGLDYFRLQFEWYRVQHALNGPLDPDDIAHIDNVLNAALARGLHCSICPFDYAHWWYEGMDSGDYWDRPDGDLCSWGIGSTNVPVSAFADLWGKLASHFKGRVWAYDLMNEPEGSGSHWPEAVVAAIAAIRAVDTTTPIIIPGVWYSTAWGWEFYPEANEVFLSLNDPYLIFEAHQYFDPNMSGVYGEDTVTGGWEEYTGTPEDRGEWCLSPFVSWLRTNNKVGLIGETNTTTTPFWLNVLDHACQYMKDNGDVLQYIQLQTAWPEGWEGYGMDLRLPTAEQWPILDQYIGGDMSVTDINITVEMVPKTYNANFTVISSVGGAVISGAVITCEGQTVTTNASGQASISGLSSGTHSFTVTANEFDNYAGSFTA